MKKYCSSLNLLKFFLFFFFWMPFGLQAQILNEKARAERYDALLNERIHDLLPELMDRHGMDMWVLISREYNEDPILRTMLPATWLNARRRTIILYYRDAGKNIFEALKDYKNRIQVTLVPNITNICYGRGVGYKIEEIVLDEKTQQISATKIREQMRKEGKLK